MANNHSEIEKHLWEAADELRANSRLESSEYFIPVLGQIFLRYANHKFAAAQKKLEGTPGKLQPFGGIRGENATGLTVARTRVGGVGETGDRHPARELGAVRC